MKLFRMLVVALICATFAAKAEAVKLYATTAAGAAGQLYQLDPATGAVIQSVGLLNDVSGNNYPITGLAFHPTTGVLYGSTGNSNDLTAALLVTINPATAAVTFVGAFNAGPVNGDGKPSTMADIGFDSAGTLYGVGSIGGPQLYSINTSTGQATVIGTTGLGSTTGGGLAISEGGTFYGTPTAGRFGTYNTGTGAFTNIANPIKPVGGGYGSLDFKGNVLYGLNVGAGSPPPTRLVIFDPSTGGVTNLGAAPDSVDAIAFLVPEPASMLLFASGLVGLLCYRRR